MTPEQQHAVLVAAFEKLRTRLLPAVLDPQSRSNGEKMKAYILSKGHVIEGVDADTLAAYLYEAVSAIAESLKWLKHPARMAKALANDKQRNQTEAKHDADAFETRRKAAEVLKAKTDADAAARRRINTAINSLRLNLAWQQQEYRQKLDVYVGHQTRIGVSLQDIATSVDQLVADIHSADEAVSEIVGGTRSIASILEKRGVNI